MENSKVAGAKQGVQTMLFYYLSTLVGTVQDPKQHIATEMAKMIDLSEEQLQFVLASIQNENMLIDNLSSSIALLENIEKTKKLDLESIGIVKDMLSIIKSQCKDALDKFTDQADSTNGQV